MTFTQIYLDANFQVLKSWGNDIRRFERNYFKVVFLNFAAENKFVFNGYTYFGYKDGDISIVEVTDRVVSEIEEEYILSIFLGESNSEIYLATTIINGIEITPILSYNLPLTIPFSLYFSDYFPISSSNNFSAGAFNNVNSYSINHITEVISQNGVSIKLHDIDCITDYAMLWWLDSVGREKAWLFKKNLLNLGSKKQLDIETGDNNYKQFRTKEYGCQLIHKGADNTTQSYMADLVFSDEVYIILDSSKKKIPVKIDETKFDVQRSKKDVVINVNIAHYDTI